MGSFLRNIVALAAIWALCELLLPEGGIQKSVRLVMSLLVMTVLVGSMADALSGLTGRTASHLTDALGSVAYESAQQAAANRDTEYTYAYLRSLANQAEDACVRMAKGAGYNARARVYLQESGALERIELQVIGPAREDTPPLVSPEELRLSITKAFQAEEFRVRLIDTDSK